MKRTIYEPSALDEILTRIKKLKPFSRGRWGRLTSEQMVRHLAQACKISFGEVLVPDQSNTLTRTIVKWLFLANIKPPGRENGNVRTFAEVDIIALNIHVGDLNTERENYEAILRRLIETKELQKKHPLFGSMSRDDWGLLAYAHADYHLTQFDV